MSHRRVLIVDDDPDVCRTIADVVEDYGFTTVCIHRDMDAYAALQTGPAFGAVVLDVNLGSGTTGFDIARFARRITPGVIVVYVSGDTSESSFRAFGVPESHFLTKPIDHAALRGALGGKGSD